MALARQAGARLRAEFVPNDRNRMMHITYKFAGFREISNDGKASVLENDLARTQEFPAYITVKVAGPDGQVSSNGAV